MDNRGGSSRVGVGVGGGEEKGNGKKTAGRKNPPDFRSTLKLPIENAMLRNACARVRMSFWARTCASRVYINVRV